MQEASDKSNEKLNIQLLIGKQLHPITILREQEETFRKAARNINERMNRYSEAYHNLSGERLMSVTLLDFAVEAITASENNDTAPYDKAITTLTEEVERALGVTPEGESEQNSPTTQTSEQKK